MTSFGVLPLSPALSLTITDLFVVGLGFDIAGAILLASGLLISPAAIDGLGTWAGLETGDTVDRCRNRCDAIFGVSFLVAGFFFQAVGYGAQLAGVQMATSTDRTVTAALLGIVAVTLAFGTWALLRGKALKWTIVSVVRAREGSGQPGDEKARTWTRHKAGRLLDLGEAAGWPPVADDRIEDGKGRYAKRVFNVELPADLTRDKRPP
jgi:hypothetical protein